MKRTLVFHSVFLFFLLTISVAAKDVWLEMNSPNFRLVGNTEEKKIRETAQKLEIFHKTFQKSFAQSRVQTPFQTNVIVLENNAFISFPQQKKMFLSADDANYIVITLENNNTETFENIFHDYVHFLINNNFGQNKIPAWLNEGLAEYFANSSKNNALLISQQNNLMPLSVLLETDNFTLQSQNEERKAIFEAQAEVFLRFLIDEKSSGNFGQIEKFIELLLKGKNSREALITMFQIDFKSIENEYRQFLKRSKISQKFEMNSDDFADDLKLKQISEAQGLAVLGDYLFYANRHKEATIFLEKALKLEPENSLALTTFSLIKAKEFYYEEAEKFAEKAIQNEPENFLNHYRYALALSKQGMTEHGFVSGYPLPLAEKMREALTKAIELNSDFTESYSLLVFVNYVRNEQLDYSLEQIKRVLEIAPGNQKYLLRLSELNLRKENFLEARKTALEVSRNAPSEQLRLYAQNTVQRIDTTEFQLERIRNKKIRYVNDDIVTEKPLSEEEIKRLRDKATEDQIRNSLRRPKVEETRVLANLIRIECGKERVDFIFKTPTGLLRLPSKSFDGISLIAFVQEMADFRLGCGSIRRENNASVIYSNNKILELISIEFVPKGFKLQN